MNYIRRGIEGSRTYIREGITEFNRGNFANALIKFEDALKSNPESIVALQYRGICKCLLAVNTNRDIVQKHRRINDAILDFKKVSEVFDKISSHPLFRNRYF